MASSEQFGIDACQTHLDAYSQVVSCKVHIDEAPWRRIRQSGQEHNHAFIQTNEGVRFTDVHQQRDGKIHGVYSYKPIWRKHYTHLAH